MKLPESSLPGEEMARVRIKRGRSGGKEKKGRKKGEMREIREGVGEKEKRGKWAGVGEKEKKEEKRGK